MQIIIPWLKLFGLSFILISHVMAGGYRCELRNPINNGELKCLDPQRLEGSVLQVPKNVTRIDKDGISICQIIEGTLTPTAIVFIMDQSGSMIKNDPDSISVLAIESGLDYLKSRDPSAHGAYLSFGSGIKDSMGLGHLNTSYLAALKDGIHKRYGGNTEPSTAIKAAGEWLNNPTYDDYSKAIIYIGDGAINDYEIDSSLAYAKSSGVPLHSILYSPSGTGTGGSIETLSQQVPGGSFKQISLVTEMSSVIDSIIQGLIISKTPTSISLENLRTQSVGVSNFSDLVQQNDGSFKMPMDVDVPLEAGMNEISLKTNYTSNLSLDSSSEINFKFDVSGESIEGNQIIEGADFDVECTQNNTLNFEYWDEALSSIDQSFKEVNVKMLYSDLENLPDSIEVLLVSKSPSDTMRTYLQLTDVAQGVYEAPVQLVWSKASNTTNQALELSWESEVVVSWQHSTDPRDRAEDSLVVNWNTGGSLEFRNKDVSIEKIHQGYNELTVFMEIEKGDNLSDSMWVVVLSSFIKDSLNVLLVRDTLAVGVHHYTSVIPIKWSSDIDIKNKTLELGGQDSVYVVWENPNYLEHKLRDSLSLEINISSLPIKAELYDNDSNGKMDSISVLFDSKVDSSSLKYISYFLNWVDVNNNPVEKGVGAGLVLQYDSIDSNRLYALFKNEDVGYKTGIKNEDVFHYKLGVTDEAPVSLSVEEFMPPIMLRAYTQLKQSRGDSLIIIWSEELEKVSFVEDLEFQFNLRPERKDEFFEVELDSNISKAVVIYGEKVKRPFIFMPRDSVRFQPNNVEDSRGNNVGSSPKWVPIVSNLKTDIYISEFVEISEGVSENEPQIIDVSLEEDLEFKVKNSNSIAVGFGPVLKKEVDGSGVDSWNWKIQIFDHLGQFVNNYSGTVGCVNGVFNLGADRSCSVGEGVQLFWEWNHRSKENRLVATGVYIVKAEITGESEKVKLVGVRRGQ